MTRIIKLFAVCALVLALSPSSPAVPGQHPHIRAALAALADARNHLRQAADDYGGHKANAIRAIEDAHRELQLCMQY
jgi:hypothetical protein